jgi:AcrR family transcriptional regulator
MPRTKIIPDAEVLAAVRRLLAEGGEKAVAFGSVARATGLAAPTLVQRYGTRDGMLRAALLAAWDTLDAATAVAEAETAISPKGAAALMKTIGAVQDEGNMASLLSVEFRDRVLRDRAEAWRLRVESALATRMGGGARGREAGAILFAAWQGQTLWQSAGGKEIRLRDLVKRLT